MKFKENKIRVCPCGCGEPLPLYFRGDRFMGYSRRIKGHYRNLPGYEQIRIARLKRLDQAHLRHEKPIGSTRLHNCRNVTYRVVKIPGFKRWKYEHRTVIENLIGRKLNPSEHVHHINGDPLDNKPENLVVLEHGDHTRVHHVNIRWSKAFDCCVICGKTDSIHVSRGRCARCYQRLPQCERTS